MGILHLARIAKIDRSASVRSEARDRQARFDAVVIGATSVHSRALATERIAQTAYLAVVLERLSKLTRIASMR